MTDSQLKSALSSLFNNFYALGGMFTAGYVLSANGVIIETSLKTLPQWQQVLTVIVGYILWPAILGMSLGGAFK